MDVHEISGNFSSSRIDMVQPDKCFSMDTTIVGVIQISRITVN